MELSRLLGASLEVLDHADLGSFGLREVDFGGSRTDPVYSSLAPVSSVAPSASLETTASTAYSSWGAGASASCTSSAPQLNETGAASNPENSNPTDPVNMSDELLVETGQNEIMALLGNYPLKVVSKIMSRRRWLKGKRSNERHRRKMADQEKELRETNYKLCEQLKETRAETEELKGKFTSLELYALRDADAKYKIYAELSQARAEVRMLEAQCNDLQKGDLRGQLAKTRAEVVELRSRCRELENENQLLRFRLSD